MKPDLVLLTRGDEQQLGVFGGQELADGVLPPPLAPVWQRLAPSVVGVGGFIPTGGQRLDNAGLPSA
jgi:hypothetical protein